MESAELLQQCLATCENHQASDVVAFDLREKSILSDYCIVCTGNTDVHIRAVVHSLEKEVRAAGGAAPRAIEGTPASHWVLVDYGDVLIHVLHPKARLFYGLEQLFAGAPILHPADWTGPRRELPPPPPPARPRARQRPRDSRPPFLR